MNQKRISINFYIFVFLLHQKYISLSLLAFVTGGSKQVPQSSETHHVIKDLNYFSYVYTLWFQVLQSETLLSL